MSRVRDAMVADPLTLDASASAQEAGARLADPGVRAVLVCDEGALAGVVTRKTLVREVVATGRDPATDASRARSRSRRSSCSTPMQELETAFRELEERDLERVPVTEDGRLVGILSRAVVQRRLAEDEPPVEEAV